MVGFRESVEAMNAGADAAGSDPVARYRALGRAYVRFACERTALFRAIHHPEVRDFRDPDLHRAERQWFETLREGAEAARRAGWHPEADTDALVAFSSAAALGAAQLLADERWRAALGVSSSDVGSLADTVLDLAVHRTGATAPRSAPDEAQPDPASADDAPADPGRSRAPARGRRRRSGSNGRRAS